MIFIFLGCITWRERLALSFESSCYANILEKMSKVQKHPRPMGNFLPRRRFPVIVLTMLPSFLLLLIVIFEKSVITKKSRTLDGFENCQAFQIAKDTIALRKVQIYDTARKNIDQN